MIIKNSRDLAVDNDKLTVLEILESGLGAALPKNRIQKFVRKNQIIIGKSVKSLSKYAQIFIVAFGKAADSMTHEVNSLTCIKGGIVVIPEGYDSVLKTKKFEIIRAGHPIPNKNSVRAANKIIKFLKERKENDFVIFLISGGSSSLVSLPDGITLDEKRIVTDLLIKCGASIDEINCVRKHLSKIKGGRILEHLRCDAISLVMSDVIGDDISSIASGTTYFDKTTFHDAEKIFKKYNLLHSIPSNVLKRIRLGIKKKIPETPKQQKIKNQIIATNKNCLDVMKKTSKNLGLTTKTVYPVSGDVTLVAKTLAKLIMKAKTNSCIIFGGETTVKVKGKGKGGRNQELVLYILEEVQKAKQAITVASIGTDGKDGNTDACGAILNNKINLAGAKKFLQNNNSHCFLKKHKGLVFTGST
ncbi:MAG: glycerate kinase type-2 family protein, partial [Nitrosopumilaceae archaeon]